MEVLIVDDDVAVRESEKKILERAGFDVETVGDGLAAFDALKPGGLYGVIDHTRRHNDPDTSENWRRMDPVLAIVEIQAAGFELVDSSDLHYRPDDELRYEVGRKTVRGNTDRFTLLFKKPADD